MFLQQFIDGRLISHFFEAVTLSSCLVRWQPALEQNEWGAMRACVFLREETEGLSRLGEARRWLAEGDFGGALRAERAATESRGGCRSDASQRKDGEVEFESFQSSYKMSLASV